MKRFRVYQVTMKGRWYLKEVHIENGVKGWINTYDVEEALLLREFQVNDLIRMALARKVGRSNICIEEVM